MPKSKRVRPVALTKTEKRSTRDHKTAYIQQVRDAVDQHDTLYLFRYENMRSNKFKSVRLHFRNDDNTTSTTTKNKKNNDAMNDSEEESDDDDDDNNISTSTTNMKNGSSRIFLGKNKLLQIALGRTSEDEYSDNLRYVSKHIQGGSVGLLMTSRPTEDVESYFANLLEPDYTRAGSVATETITATADMLQQFPVSMMEQLRKLGMPVMIKDGRIVFRDEPYCYTICKQGQVLSAEQCKLLVHFQVPLSNFKVELVCRWTKDGGEFYPFDLSN